MRRARFLCALLLCTAAPAFAQDLQLHGFVDWRLVGAPQERSWLDGGLVDLQAECDVRALA